jgi:thiamine pyrophosphate-dependent acetolactate synthase large subunit-like protein
MDSLVRPWRDAWLSVFRANPILPSSMRWSTTPMFFDLILCRQEGGAAYMAAAWGKLTGAPGPVFCYARAPAPPTPPSESIPRCRIQVPMILFVGQVGTDVKGREAFQEVDYAAFFGPLAKWAWKSTTWTAFPRS